MKPVDQKTIKLARGLAVAADTVQWALLPLFVEGGASPFNDALDVAMMGLMVWLLGFHWAFLPSAVAEAVPVLNLAPTWTAAVLIATRQGATKALPEVKAEVVVDAEVVKAKAHDKAALKKRGG